MINEIKYCKLHFITHRIKYFLPASVYIAENRSTLFCFRKRTVPLSAKKKEKESKNWKHVSFPECYQQPRDARVPKKDTLGPKLKIRRASLGDVSVGTYGDFDHLVPWRPTPCPSPLPGKDREKVVRESPSRFLPFPSSSFLMFYSFSRFFFFSSCSFFYKM